MPMPMTMTMTMAHANQKVIVFIIDGRGSKSNSVEIPSFIPIQTQGLMNGNSLDSMPDT
jgi:hypothetical protein